MATTDYVNFQKTVEDVIALLLLALKAKIINDNNGPSMFRVISNTSALVATDLMLALEKAGRLPSFLYFETAQSGGTTLISVCRYNKNSGRTTVIKIPGHLFNSKAKEEIAALAETSYTMPNSNSKPFGQKKEIPTQAEVYDAARKLLTEERLNNAGRNVAAKPLELEFNQQQREYQPQNHPQRTSRSQQMIYA